MILKFAKENTMTRRWRLAAFLLFASVAGPAMAQDSTKLRVDKLEKEMKAVQRVVFPNGQPVESEINAASGGALGSPSSSPVADLTARVDALESQLKSLTGQVEQDGFRLKKLEESVKLLETRTSSTAVVPAAPSATPPAARRNQRLHPLRPSQPRPLHPPRHKPRR
jgi:polyhydroxyalkanoate synthesis regulator phasin